MTSIDLETPTFHLWNRIFCCVWRCSTSPPLHIALNTFLSGINTVIVHVVATYLCARARQGLQHWHIKPPSVMSIFLLVFCQVETKLSCFIFLLVPFMAWVIRWIVSPLGRKFKFVNCWNVIIQSIDTNWTVQFEFALLSMGSYGRYFLPFRWVRFW